MEDIYKLIDDINLQKIENLDSRVNEALNSNNDDALFILGETLYNFGLTPQGLEVFRTLYHKYPDESELLIYFIEGLMSENQTDEALEYLAQVEPSTEKLMLEADLYQQINMLEVAIDKLQEALDLEPNDPIIHFALAELLYYDGQYLRATREDETVLDGHIDVQDERDAQQYVTRLRHDWIEQVSTNVSDGESKRPSEA